jgi:hypothetical protein
VTTIMIPFALSIGAMLALASLAFVGSTPGLCGADLLTVQEATASTIETVFVPARAVDGDPTSRWASNSDGHQWLKLDMGGPHFIQSISLLWQHAYSEDYDIEVSADSTDLSWTAVRSYLIGTEGKVVLSNLDVVARYIRINSFANSGQYGISLYEVEVFGDADVSCTPDTTPPTCIETDIAAAAVAASSEQAGSNWNPEKAIDRDSSTRWSSDWLENQWIALDLGAKTLISSVSLDWEAHAASYVLEVGDSLLGPWTPVFSETAGNGGLEILADLNVVTQYVRLSLIRLIDDRLPDYNNTPRDI